MKFYGTRRISLLIVSLKLFLRLKAYIFYYVYSFETYILL